MRVAAIDCGTNSVRLLVTENGRELARDLVITRLGQGVDATGRFAAAALTRTLAAADQYAQTLADLDVPVTNRRFVATSAARDAANRDEFYAGIAARLGVIPEIISGDEEARLSFAGATAALPASDEPVLVFDIGGGSTELVAGRGSAVHKAISLDVGSVRVKERYLVSDPPAATEVASARAFIDGLLDGSGINFAEVTRLIGVGGTATCLSALDQGLTTYDRSRVHGSVLTTDRVVALASKLRHQTVRQIRLYPTMPAGRADVISSGALICEAIATRGAAPVTVSEADILDGLVADIAARMV